MRKISKVSKMSISKKSSATTFLALGTFLKIHLALKKLRLLEFKKIVKLVCQKGFGAKIQIFPKLYISQKSSATLICSELF